MVDARERAPSEEEEKDESFIDKPAILDKFKAAGLITNGKPLLLSELLQPLLNLSLVFVCQVRTSTRYARQETSLWKKK